MDILAKIHLNPSLDTPLVLQLKEQLIWLIASGQIQPGEHLPSARQAANRLGINLHTVRSAYHKMEASGLVEIRQGMATKVLPYNAEHLEKIANTLSSHTVGVIIPSLTNPFYHPFLQGIESVAKKSFTMLFICVSHDDPDEVQRSYAQLVAKNVDGILLASQDDSPFSEHNPSIRESQTNSLPLVVADWLGGSRYSVTFDLENAGYLATRHLLEHGHRRVGLITYAIDLKNVTPVNQGYHRALHEWGISGSPDLIALIHGFDTSAGSEGARMLLANKPPPTAIFAISDLLASGAMRTLQQAGLHVPKDIAIVGFNDIPLAEMVSPALTTVSAPAYLMGLRAMKMLKDLIVGKKPSVHHAVLPTNLVIRQSCGCQESTSRYH
ncbi:MAG: hypothetical protein C3F13_14375 [Anaerolineales bacterium]|nr:MAG: hypothetical protein C3F13_14375 [Anaerolineales bacterium]